MGIKNNAALDIKVNLALYNSVASFIIKNRSKDSDIRTFKDEFAKSPLYDLHMSNEIDVSNVYDVRYVGEFYERFKEKGIKEIRDVRALALALADTVSIQNNEMFVGSQRTDFIKKIKALYDEKFDVYLGVALLKLSDGAEGKILCRQLLEKHYSDTEDLIYAAHIASEGDTKDVFEIFKEQFVNLLGKKRSISVQENEKLYGSFVDLFFNILKDYRKKDTQFLKAFCIMPEKRLGEDTSQYKILKENGYTDKDILYLNYFICKEVKSCSKNISGRTIVFQKLAVDYCRCLLSSEEKITDVEKEIFIRLLQQYKKFEIKCNGFNKISQCFEDIKIGNSNTFIWFVNADVNLIPNYTSNVFRFDILNEKSGDIIKKLDYKQKYLFLNYALHSFDSDQKETAEKYITEFEKYDNFNYSESFKSYNSDCYAFALIVDMGIEDIFKYAENVEDLDYHIKDLIKNYLYGIKNFTAYKFIEKFAGGYGIEKIKSILDFDLYDTFMKRSGGSYGYSRELDISRKFLTREQHRNIFGWLTEYIFYNKQEDYVEFIYKVLMHKNITEYFTQEELQELFRVSRKPLEEKYSTYTINSLHKMYLTEDELEELRKKKEDAETAKHEKEMSDIFKAKINSFKSIFDGSFKSIIEFTEKNCIYSREKDIVYKLVFIVSEELLKQTNFLTESEAINVCSIYFKLLNNAQIDCKKFYSVIRESEKMLGKI